MSKWEMKDPSIGDHIRVQMGALYHHAIYIGNDEVIQFGHPFDYQKSASNVFVIKSPIDDFLRGGFLEVRVYDRKERKKKRKPEEIVQEAYRHLGEGGYHILNNNCEHFANYCVFGVKFSEQIDAAHAQIKDQLNTSRD